MSNQKFSWRYYISATLVTSLWVHASEVFRYFILVRPRAKAYWNDLAQIADMNATIFLIWGVWDTLLTAMIAFMYWLYIQVFPNNSQAVLVAGTISWLFFFVLYWVGAANMGYSSWQILWITLPLSWLEVIIACLILKLWYQKQNTIT